MRPTRKCAAATRIANCARRRVPRRRSHSPLLRNGCGSLEARTAARAAIIASRAQELGQSRQALTDGRAKLSESQQTMLRASSVLAYAYLDKEEAQRRFADMVVQRDQKRQERARLTQQAQTVRAEWRTHQEAVHQRELEATNLRHQRDTLVQRLREDYQLELAELVCRLRLRASRFKVDKHGAGR